MWRFRRPGRWPDGGYAAFPTAKLYGPVARACECVGPRRGCVTASPTWMLSSRCKPCAGWHHFVTGVEGETGRRGRANVSGWSQEYSPAAGGSGCRAQGSVWQAFGGQGSVASFSRGQGETRSGNEKAKNAYLSCHYVISLQVRDRPSEHLFRRNE